MSKNNFIVFYTKHFQVLLFSVILVLDGAFLEAQVKYGSPIISEYPEFSWDHVPLYLFLRKAEAFSPEELEFISSFPVVTMAMTTGMDTYGSTEEGIMEASKAIKSINPGVKTIYYRNTLVHYNYYKADSTLTFIQKPFLEDKEGNINLHVGKRPLYDLSNKEVQKWWADHVITMSNHEMIDGIFFDGVGKIISNYLIPMVGELKQQEVLGGYKAMVNDCVNRMDSSKIKIANLLRANFPGQGLSYLSPYDGSYIEHFDRDVEWTEAGIQAVQKAAREGNIICMTFDVGQTFSNDNFIIEKGDIQSSAELQERFEYCLALFLICAEKYSYFYFHDGYSVNPWSDNRFWMHRFPEYDYPLGAPLGPAKKTGTMYTREFEHATVSVDISNESANILWQTTEIKEAHSTLNQGGIRCYKRLASNHLIVESPDDMCEIAIYKTEGKLISTGKPMGKSYTLKIPAYNNSIFLLRVKLINGQIITKKIYIV